MILRQLQWVLLTKLLYSIIIVESQNDRSYDTNDWIPVTPTPNGNEGAVSKVAAGRVLNLDAPAQKFFPEEEYNYRKRKPQAPQFLRENPSKPTNPRHKHKNTDSYIFQVPPKAQPVRLATYEQPPPISQGGFPDKTILTRQQAPAVDASSIYDQYNLPFNSTFYQSLNPGSINRELQNSFENQNLLPDATPSASIKDEKQDIQLLYVPLENLKPNQQIPENVYQQFTAPRQKQQIFSQNNQHLIDDIEHDLIQQTVQAHRLQQQIHLGRPIAEQLTTSTTTTAKPTKRKPHQPPLAVYLENNNGGDVDDVLNALKDAKYVAVQDAVSPNSPRVFIGPSTINLPTTYTRFPLPYINKIEGNRIERKIENLPFFVAPLSYKTPEGYSKIPLPSPHVGSVVVSNKEESHKRSAPKPVLTYPNQIKEYETVKTSYSIPSGTPNPPVFDPTQLTYYSSTPILNPTNEAQRPNYLQFGVNDVSQFSVSSKPTEQLQQSQISNTPVNPYKTPVQSVSYNQAGVSNPSPQITPQQIVPDGNISPYSSPVRSANEEQSKYSFNQDQNINSYRTPSIPVSNRETISSYQIPVSNPTGVTQYNQHINENNESFTVPQTINTKEQNSYHTPSRGLQRGRHPSTSEGLQNTGTPSISTTSNYDKPPSFVSSQYGGTHEISITPKTSTSTTTTTTKPTEDPHRYSTKKQNPLELTINQYELHQINSQLVPETTEKEAQDPYDFSSPFRYEFRPKDFDYSSKFAVERSKKGQFDYSSVFDIDVDKPKFDYSSEFDRYTSTPASILRDTFEDYPTTSKISPKSHRRGKPTRQPARTTTTGHTPGRESYTVLEEFSAKQVNRPQTTETLKELTFKDKYKIPPPPDFSAVVYRGRTTSPKYEEIKVEPVTIQYDNIKTVIEDIPSKTYNLNVNQNTPVYTSGSTENIPTQNIEKQTVQSSFGRQEEVTHPPTYVQSPLTEVSYSPDYNENSDIKPLVQNRGQKQQDQSYNFDSRHPNLPDYTSTTLQDHSVKTSLLPNLPSTEDYYNPNFESVVQQPITTTTATLTTTTTTTTERPTTTHATRSRGRQRGGSRFSSASATTVASVPRRTVNRRRPVHTSRTTTTTTTTTTESPNSQYSSNEDFPKVTRQRFRTRGRPSQTVATERISSTENEVRSYRERTSETPLEIQTDPTSPQSYMKFEHTVEDQKVIIQQEQVPVTDYPQYYSPQLPVTVTDSPRVFLQYDNTASTQNPIMDIQITHPVPKIKKQPAIRTNDDDQVHLRAGGVLNNSHNNNNNEDSPRQTTRVRGRGRSRPRVATTTTEKTVIRTTGRPVIRVAPKRTTTVGTTTTTPPKPEYKSAAEEEFFGFIRQPNFSQVYNIPVPSATQQPLHVYQNNPNQPADTDVRVSTYQVFGSQNTNSNVRVQSYQIPQDPEPVDDVRLNFNGAASDPTTVHFVGEIRPKYRPTTQSYEESIAVTDSTEPLRADTDTPRPRVRGRVRTPQRKLSPRPSENEVSTYRTQQATRRSNAVRSRGRGTAHYQPPGNLRSKEDKDAEVEGGNYPPQFFHRQAAATSAPTFQISIDPAGEDEYGDQQPNPSLYQPKILPKPDVWTEVTETTANDEEFAPANAIEDDIHIRGETISPTEQPKGKSSTKATTADDEQTTDQPIALPVTASDELTTQSSDETYKKDTKAMEELFEEINKTDKPRNTKGKRRGAWKLIRQRPVDTYEVAESQNYYSVVNAYGDIVKVKDKVKNDKENEESSLGQHELYNNYNPVLEQNSETYDYESKKLPSTDKPQRNKTNKYYEVYDLNAETEQSVLEALSTVQPETSENGTETNTQPDTTTAKDSSLFDTIYEMFGISKAEDVDEVSITTTSTAESETVPPTITTVSPTFPEEITEFTTTQGPLESTSGGSTGTTEEQESTSPKTQVTRTFDVEPWQMKAVRTSTSTEVSHETEICYKGRCVRSNDRKGL